MKTYLPAALAGLGLLAGACVGTPEPPAPVEGGAFSRALNFDCGNGSRLDVVFHETDLLARLDGGEGMVLKAVEPSDDARTYSAGGTTLKYDGGQGMTYSSGGSSKSCQFVSRSLGAPMAEGVVKTLVQADAGKTVEVKTGEKVAVALVGVPTAGYVWGASSPPAWIKASDGPGGATTTAQFLPGFAGGSHWEVVIIEAVAAGEGEITLAQRRPWESQSEPDAETFKFRLKAS